ncbi:hypothetical protein BDW75DRAFT_235169 [Aspergillus navahoensis]
MNVNKQAPQAASVDCYDVQNRPSECQLKSHLEKSGWAGPPFNATYAGSYQLDYAQYNFPCKLLPDWRGITDFVMTEVKEYQESHIQKFIGLAMSSELAESCPDLCSRLWLELDIIPMVLSRAEESVSWGSYDEALPLKSLDERAESIARKCLRFFGPNQAPSPQIGSQGLVEVDAAFHVKMTKLSDYEKTVGAATWSAVNKFTSDIKKRKVKIAFFSATPQGGGVALMRHALVRFARVLGVELNWYVPKPRPGIFRITKNNHNILQGVAPPDTRFTPQDRDTLRDWVLENAERFWFRQAGPPAASWLRKYAISLPAMNELPWLHKHGPLVHPTEGGADVIIIDDPQLPFLIPLIKERTPDRPVIFRSHIQIRSDLIATQGTPQAEAWELLWESIKQADVFISHPVRAFVPNNVAPERTGYMPASTDWLDGLNKPLDDWSISYYCRIFNSRCKEQSMPTINFPSEDYIVQVARFDPSKGICDVLTSYNAFHKRLSESRPDLKPPKLLICGHGSVDDPDLAIVYNSVLQFVEQYLKHIKSSVCIMRIDPSDQMLNTLLTRAKIALQLSTREGFEVKVSEALHKGKPVIATLAGGIPLQVQHGKNGFLVKPGDTNAVAEHLFDLWADQDLYDRMSRYAAKSVSDEVSTVGDMLSWLYLAARLSQGEKIRPNEGWINDMARSQANEPYHPEENKLKRVLTTSKAT